MKNFYKISLSSIFAFSLTHSICAQTEREKGVELYEKGDYPAAIEILQKATEADKKDGIAWRFLGMAYARTKNLKKLEKHLMKPMILKIKIQINFMIRRLNSFLNHIRVIRMKRETIILPAK